MNAGNPGFLEAAYGLILGREPDPVGFEHNLRRLRMGVRRGQVLSDLARSDEAVARAAETSFLLGVEGGPPGVAEVTVGSWMIIVRRTLPARVRMKVRSAGRRLAGRARSGVSQMASRVRSTWSQLARRPDSIASPPPSRVLRTDATQLQTAVDQGTRHDRSLEEREDRL